MAQNVVITGANRGIGLAMAEIYAARGDKVFAVCRHSSAKLDALMVNVIEDVDVSTDVGIERLSNELSGIEIDVLINNAGILRDESLSDLNMDTINEQFQVNTLGPLKVSHALLSNLNPGSKLALITSRMGSIADNTSGGRYGYRMSKAALNAAGMSLAQDLMTENIAVGIYHPGYVQTDMVNNRGDIPASEAANRIVKLIDNLTLDESGLFRHSNGEVLPW